MHDIFQHVFLWQALHTVKWRPMSGREAPSAVRSISVYQDICGCLLWERKNAMVFAFFNEMCTPLLISISTQRYLVCL